MTPLPELHPDEAPFGTVAEPPDVGLARAPVFFALKMLANASQSAMDPVGIAIAVTAWGILGIRGVGLPFVSSENFRPFLAVHTAACVGWLARDCLS